MSSVGPAKTPKSRTQKSRQYPLARQPPSSMVVAEQRDKTLCVLITGASRGIGLELVKQYLLRVGRGNYGRGGHVIACARDPDKSMDLLRCFTVDYVSYELVPLDVTDPGSFGDLHEHLQDLDRIKELDGVPQKIDIVFNNAGVALGRDCSLGTVDYDAWRTSFDTNVMGAVRVVETVLPHLADDATIVNVSSGLGSIGRVMNGGFNTLTQDVIYRSTKAALNMTTACCAAELRARAPDRGMKVVSIDPGWVNTDMGSRGGTVKPPLEPEQVVRGMIDVVADLKPEDSGKFLSWEGAEMPW